MIAKGAVEIEGQNNHLTNNIVFERHPPPRGRRPLKTLWEEEKLLENIAEKEENSGKQHFVLFSFFPQCF